MDCPAIYKKTAAYAAGYLPFICSTLEIEADPHACRASAASGIIRIYIIA